MAAAGSPAVEVALVEVALVEVALVEVALVEVALVASSRVRSRAGSGAVNLPEGKNLPGRGHHWP
ncbi:MAG: hypothetical protein FJ104_10750 [Deltaproteobacteria bacterium]|nr:hypothetical protein [Deltaproteobacteria bacterium]